MSIIFDLAADKIKWDAVDVSAASAPTPHSEEIAVEARIEWVTPFAMYQFIRALAVLPLTCTGLDVKPLLLSQIQFMLQTTKETKLVLSYSRIRAIDNLTTLNCLLLLRLDNNEIGTLEAAKIHNVTPWCIP